MYAATAQDTVNSLATGLGAFAVAALIAGALAVGQAARRHLASSPSPTPLLRALGLRHREVAMAHVAPLLVPITIGILAGAPLAVAISPLFPMGLAARAEADPGLWLAPGVLGAGGAGLVLIFAVQASILALRAPRTTRTRNRGASRSQHWMSRAGSMPSVDAGMDLVADRGRGATATPVRSAYAGLVVAVAGIVGVGVIVASIDHLDRTPSAWGWVWSTTPDYFGNGSIDSIDRELALDTRLDAVGTWTSDSIVVGGTPITTYALKTLRGTLDPTTTAGRLPVGATEVALGRATMRALVSGSVTPSTPRRPPGTRRSPSWVRSCSRRATSTRSMSRR